MLIAEERKPTLYDIINLYGYEVFDTENPYPIWDEGKREWLNNTIINHFLYREISPDTSTNFIRLLNNTMRDIMLTMNPIFKALGDMPDALSGFESDSISSAENKSNSNSTESAGQKNLLSVTPQTQLSGKENYATQLTEQEADNMRKSDDTSSGLTTSKTSGRNMSVASQLADYMAGINNGLYIIYNGLEPLFNQVWTDDLC